MGVGDQGDAHRLVQASPGSVPLTRSVFWGPMAIAIMGGLTVATVLTIFFVPALYAAWFKVRRVPAPGTDPVPGTPALAA